LILNLKDLYLLRKKHAKTRGGRLSHEM
jgi:hypothetical protein